MINVQSIGSTTEMIWITTAKHVTSVIRWLRRQRVITETLSRVFNTSDGVPSSSACIDALADGHGSSRIHLVREGTRIAVDIAAFAAPVAVRS